MQQRWWSPVPAATPVGALHPQVLPTSVYTLYSLYSLHTFTAHSATVIRMEQCTVEIRGIVVLIPVCRCSSTFPTILLPPVCLPVGAVPKFSLPPVCPQFSPPPLDPPEPPLCSPLLTQETPFSEQQRTPHSVSQTPILDLIVGPMTIQTMKAWNSFSC